MRWKRYTQYKDSGIEWLGVIPEGWDVHRITSISEKLTNGYVGPTRDIFFENGVVYLQSLHIKNNKIIFDNKYFVSEEWSRVHKKSVLREGDVLIVQTGDIGQVSVVTKEYEGANCHALIILSCRRNVSIGKYISWALNSSYGYHSLKRIQTGALHPHLNCTIVREIYIPIPSLKEQKKIATFLDRETSRIDKLIEKKEKQIELLKEKRAALISHAVTKGLDPKVKMKDSGIEWLGEIPEGWRIERLRFFIKLNPPKSELNRTNPEKFVSFVPMESIKELGGMHLEQIKKIYEVYNGYTYFTDGDIVVAKITPCFENGKGSIAEDLMNGIGFGTTELHVLRPYKNTNKKYLFYLTISHQFRKMGTAFMQGSAGQKRVPENFIRNFIHPLPSYIEQNSIATFLDRKTTKIDALIEKVQKSIELLKEYRTAIISAAVTGKIDVRGTV